MIKLHIGCGLDFKEDDINIDIESKESLLARYEGTENVIFKSFQEKGIEIYNYNIFDLPYGNHTVDEVLCNAFLEHLDFVEERKFFFEIKRILKSGGLFKFSVPDFEWVVKEWVKANDDWKDFYYTDKGEHWFGQKNRSLDTRWGYLIAAIFGNQNGVGQYHKNGYTRQKVNAMLAKIGFQIIDMNESYYRGKFEKILEYTATKQPD